MPRIRRTITESIEHLKKLETELEGTPTAPIITMLRLLREDPSRTLIDIAKMLRKSERTVRRWWEQYSQGKIWAITRDKANGITLVKGEMNDTSRTLASESGAGNRSVSENGTTYETIEYIQLHSLIDSNGIDKGKPIVSGQTESFLNSIFFYDNAARSIAAFAEALRHFLLVDRVSITLRTSAAYQDERSNDEKICVHHDARADGADHISVLMAGHVEDHVNLMLQQYKSNGYPVDSYHLPVMFSVHSEDHHYLGALFLWTLKTKAARSDAVVSAVQSLGQFISTLFAEFIVRSNRAVPTTQAFYESFEVLRRSANLSRQEERVALMLLSGHTYKDIAAALRVDISTIKKHAPRIYKKAGVESLGELFAKYFTMRVDYDHDKR
jgi:DNA-binding CsgD family transcriptional regulator